MYQRSDFAKPTYIYLLFSLLAAMWGASWGSQTPFLMEWLSTWTGWIGTIIVMNIIPKVAIAIHHKSVAGFLMLLVKGIFYGMVLGPIVSVSQNLASNIDIIKIALIATGLIFVFFTIIVKISGGHYQLKKGLMRVVTFSLLGAVILNLMMPIGVLGLLISIGIGFLGAIILMYATAGILNYQGTDSPTLGALMLFSALFDIFTAVIHLVIMNLPHITQLLEKQ